MGYGRFKKFLDKEDKLYRVIAEEVERYNALIYNNRIKGKKHFGWNPSRFKTHVCAKMLVYQIVLDSSILNDPFPFENIVKMEMGTAGHNLIQKALIVGKDYGDFQILSIEDWIPQNKYAVFGRSDMIYFDKDADHLIVLDFKFKQTSNVFKMDEYYYPQMNMYMHLLNITHSEFMYFWFNDFGKLNHKNYKYEYDSEYVYLLLKNMMYAALCLRDEFVPPAECEIMGATKSEKAKNMFCPFWKICEGKIDEKIIWERNSYVLKQLAWCLE